MIDIPLSRPYQADGREVAALSMREPVLRDLHAPKDGSDGEREIGLFANLCMETPELIADLFLVDYGALQDAYRNLTSLDRRAHLPVEIDGSAAIPLLNPVQHDGAEIAALSMREPKARDQRDSEKGGGGEPERELRLFVSLCDVPASVLLDLWVVDYRAVQGAYRDFSRPISER